MLPWEVEQDQNIDGPLIKYYDNITYVYLVNKEGYIINHIVIGGYPYLPFHHPDYMLIPSNTFNAIIGCKLDSNSHDKLISEYISQKQRSIKELENNAKNYDTNAICKHEWHNHMYNTNANLSEKIKADLQSKSVNEIPKPLKICSCNISNENIRIIPLHSPEPYTRNEAEDFLSISDHETADLIMHSPDVDWMLTTCIQPLTINNLNFEINRNDIESRMTDKDIEIRYIKWIEKQMEKLGKDMQLFTR